jgi:hypothetical protein
LTKDKKRGAPSEREREHAVKISPFRSEQKRESEISDSKETENSNKKGHSLRVRVQNETEGGRWKKRKANVDICFRNITYFISECRRDLRLFIELI